MNDVAPEPSPRPAAGADDSAFAAAKARDAALVLPIIGLLLFTPPLIGIVVTDLTILGAPLIVTYLFLSWAFLIVCAGLLSRSLIRAARQEDARTAEPSP
jgi:putative effector of murein hydrolase LrgA (UPF0299 family)